jgi:hypothetical protein
MTSSLKLLPFKKTDSAHVVTVDVTKNNELLNLIFSIKNFQLHKPVALTDFQLNNNFRSDELWKHTCLEIFIGTEDSDEYREFNFSTSGKWNCYHFGDYRKAMRQEPDTALLMFSAMEDNEDALFNIKIKLPEDLASRDSLFCSPAVIIESKNKTFEYHASSHNNIKPDFHLKDARTVII